MSRYNWKKEAEAKRDYIVVYQGTNITTDTRVFDSILLNTVGQPKRSDNYEAAAEVASRTGGVVTSRAFILKKYGGVR